MKTIRTIKREAKAALKGHWGIAIGILIIMYLITGALNLVAPTENNYDSTAIVLSILSVLIAVFVTLSISTGFVWFYLRLFDGESLKVVNLFDAFKKGMYLKAIWANILIALLLIMWSLPTIILAIVISIAAAANMLSFWYLIVPVLLMLLPIIKTLGYEQTFYLIKDNPTISAYQAVKTSVVLMKNKRMKLFLTYLSFIGWMIVPLILLAYGTYLAIIDFMRNGDGIEAIIGVGLILLGMFIGMIVCLYVIPYFQTTMASFYRSLQPKEVVESSNDNRQTESLNDTNEPEPSRDE
ncbi:DUF975 family protein [Brochothrix campestris]|uniref:Integral membrane protein n=1 Tax=Brochothrix campestris FSL F6-1037 TaxID=1265861 RepID=W7CR70_9LIST|nr:DUF975 family protein [Brochothrix campestris]EUJ35463.1 hypothetical protein BCAMP_11735 [Brochothrix campestris FSL F6-1037]